MEDIKYKYFISYIFNNEAGTGYGSAELTRNNRIENYNDLLEITKSIKEKHNFLTVTILNFKEF